MSDEFTTNENGSKTPENELFRVIRAVVSQIGWAG